jgi:dihydroxyacetone kinase
MLIANLLSTGTSENVVQVVGQKEEAMRLDLILEELSSGIVDHGESGRVAPFQETGLLHRDGST